MFCFKIILLNNNTKHCLNKPVDFLLSLNNRCFCLILFVSVIAVSLSFIYEGAPTILFTPASFFGQKNNNSKKKRSDCTEHFLQLPPASIFTQKSLFSDFFFFHWVQLAAHIMTEPDTIGYYLVQWDPFGVLSGRGEVWKLVSVDPWLGPTQSQWVSFYGNGAIVTTSRQRPAACLASSIESICRKWGTLWDVQWPVIKPTLTYTVIYRLWISLNPSFTLLTS